MTFNRFELFGRLDAMAIPASTGWQLPDDTFETVESDYLPRVWSAWVESLRLNAPECLHTIEIGGGKTRLVPKYQVQAGDCENLSLLCLAHAMTGNWIGACRGGPRVGRTLGIAFYTATPRPENRNVSGPHCQLWQIDHGGNFQTFEPQLGEFVPWLKEEYPTAIFGIAA